MVTVNDILTAHENIRPYTFVTSMEYSPKLSEITQGEVFLKLENQQISGSFKSRGAFNKILSIPESQRKGAYFIAASTGNHAAAFCTALVTLGLSGKVFLPTNISDSKLEYIASFGIPYELVGTNSLHTEIYAGKIAKKHGYVLVHPYNDIQIIAGQGTIGIEMLAQKEDLDTVIVPVGGGGMISGIGAYVKVKFPTVDILGCQPEQSPEMVLSLNQGKIIEEDISKPTLSDGTAGGMEPGSITFDHCRDLVDDWMLMTEEEIANGILFALKYHQMVVEGSAALSIAWLLKETNRFKGKKVGLVICGKRISLNVLKSLICTQKKTTE